MGSRKTGSDLDLASVHCVLRHFKQYFSYVVAVSTRRKPPTCRKSLTNFIT